jgi:Zn-dependent protease with chaperone function
MSFESYLTQVFQPYFYYSVIFLVISFITVKLLTRYCSLIGQKTKSLLYFIPLSIPLVVMVIFNPSTVIQSSGNIIKTTAGQTAQISSYAGPAMLPMLPPPGPVFLARAIQIPTVYSITGIVCLVGLAVGGLFALLMLSADDRVARRILHVIPLAPGENPRLQAKIAELSARLSIAAPRIGLIEDLRPNAFTIGYAENSTIVFSLGLLKTLNEEEVWAVAAHELAHIKNYDFFYKTASSALTVVSFFNPLAYLASTSGQREREMLADEHAVQLLDRPEALGNALAKICKALQNLPKESLFVSFQSNLLVSSSVLHRVGILSTHPRLDLRLHSIAEPKSAVRPNKQKATLAVVLSMLVIISAVAAGGVMVNLQVGFAAAHQTAVPSPQFNDTAYTVSSGSGLHGFNPVMRNASGAIFAGAPQTVFFDQNNRLSAWDGNGEGAYYKPFIVQSQTNQVFVCPSNFTAYP